MDTYLGHADSDTLDQEASEEVHSECTPKGKTTAGEGAQQKMRKSVRMIEYCRRLLSDCLRHSVET